MASKYGPSKSWDYGYEDGFNGLPKLSVQRRTREDTAQGVICFSVLAARMDKRPA